MAWNNVECAKCSREYRVQLYGPTKQREWKVANWNGLCDTCYADSQKQREIERDKRVESANCANKSGKTTELVGSPKQIAWAMSIRQEHLNEWDERKPLLKNNDLAKKLANAVEAHLGNPSAKWWIENRHYSLMQIIEAIAEKI